MCAREAAFHATWISAVCDRCEHQIEQVYLCNSGMNFNIWVSFLWYSIPVFFKLSMELLAFPVSYLWLSRRAFLDSLQLCCQQLKNIDSSVRFLISIVPDVVDAYYVGAKVAIYAALAISVLFVDSIGVRFATVTHG